MKLAARHFLSRALSGKSLEPAITMECSPNPRFIATSEQAASEGCEHLTAS